MDDVLVELNFQMRAVELMTPWGVSGKAWRNLYFKVNHKPKTRSGNRLHHTNISGNVIICRRLATCQGKGANKR